MALGDWLIIYPTWGQSVVCQHILIDELLLHLFRFITSNNIDTMNLTHLFASEDLVSVMLLT